jgi:hypothetical protein
MDRLPWKFKQEVRTAEDNHASPLAVRCLINEMFRQLSRSFLYRYPAIADERRQKRKDVVWNRFDVKGSS